jgi:hypothetical protein
MKKQTDHVVVLDPMKQLNESNVAHCRRKRITEISLKVRTESIKINAEFSVIEDAPNT